MKEKTFVLIFEDSNRNELTRKYTTGRSIHEVRAYAKKLYETSRINNLEKILVRMDY